MARRHEVVVVGGGPGGCATALHLADRGHEVLIVDRERPRAGGKVCGEGLMPHGHAALARLGIRAEGLGRPFVGIVYHAGDHVAVGSFSGGRIGVGVRRAVLDPRLREAVAARPSISVETGVRVTGLSGAPGRMVLASSAGDIEARVVVGADGLHSTIRTLAGLGATARGSRRYGARVHLRWPQGRHEPDHVHVYAGGGSELYLTPVGPSEVNVALLCDAGTARSLKGDREARFRAIAEGFEAGLFAGAQALSEVSVCGPLRQRARSAVGDGVVLVGDAAGFVDAVTGEGMSLTLLSAELAAEAVSTALYTGRVDRRALQPYARRRARLVRTLCTLTEVVVLGLRHPAWAQRVVAALAARPAAFERFLAVQTGEGSLWSLAPALASVVLALGAGGVPPNGQLAAP